VQGGERPSQPPVKECDCKDTILLVDDNEYNLYALRIMLEIFHI